jgi:hypothetical protein
MPVKCEIRDCHAPGRYTVTDRSGRIVEKRLVCQVHAERFALAEDFCGEPGCNRFPTTRGWCAAHIKPGHATPPTVRPKIDEPPPLDAPALRARVLSVVREYPNLTQAGIARHIDASVEAVAATLSVLLVSQDVVASGVSPVRYSVSAPVRSEPTPAPVPLHQAGRLEPVVDAAGELDAGFRLTTATATATAEIPAPVVEENVPVEEIAQPTTAATDTVRSEHQHEDQPDDHGEIAGVSDGDGDGRGVDEDDDVITSTGAAEAPARSIDPAPADHPSDPAASIPLVLAALQARPDGALPAELGAESGVPSQRIGMSLGVLSRRRKAHRVGDRWFPGPAPDGTEPQRPRRSRAPSTPTTWGPKTTIGVLEAYRKLLAGGVDDAVAIGALNHLLGPADVDILLDHLRHAPVEQLLRWAAQVNPTT